MAPLTDTPPLTPKELKAEDFRPPCSKPHDEPCKEPCPSPEELGCDENMVPIKSGYPEVIQTGFYNAFKIAFDEIKAEPLRILMIGGCRQREFARFLGFLLPITEIVVLDPDAGEVERAKEEVCCRFHFAHSTVESLPFEDNSFDLTLGHHVFEYVSDWSQAMAEIARVTSKNTLLTTTAPFWWNMVRSLPGMAVDLKRSGLSLPPQAPKKNDFLTEMARYGHIKNQSDPLPWKMVITEMKADTSHRTVLSH